MSELSIVVVLTVREGTEEEMRRELGALVAPSRLDHGNLQYELYGDPADARRFVFVQRWVDEAAHRKHDKESDHITRFTRAHGSKIQNVDLYKLERIG